MRGMKDRIPFAVNNITCVILLSLFCNAASAVEFNTDVLDAADKKNIDFTRFSEAGYVLPGQYLLDVIVNGQSISPASLQISFVEPALSGDKAEKKLPQACLTSDMVRLMGLTAESLDKVVYWHYGQCADFHGLPGVDIRPDTGAGVLRINMPQAWLEYSDATWLPPSRWDDGIPGLMLDYNLNGTVSRNYQGGDSHQFSYNGTVGGNLGPWRLRADYQGSQEQSRYNGEKTTNRNFTWSRFYLFRAIPRWRANLTLGENNINSDIFRSWSYTGASLESDDRMLPPRLRGYAPQITGIAETNARVVVSQQGRVLYDSMVPAGPFSIQDLDSSVRGRLDVEVIEQNGRKKTFQVDTASVPYLTRPGQVRYKLVSGRSRGYGHETEGPVFATGEASWGLSNQWSLYGGAVLAGDYNALAAGAGWDLGVPGTLSADITQSVARIEGERTFQGKSWRLSYSKRFDNADADITFAGYRFSERNYMTMEQYLNARYRNDYSSREKEMYTVTLNKNVADWNTSFNLQYSRQTYWDIRKTDYYTVSVNRYFNVFGLQGVAVGLAASRSKYLGRDNDSAYLRISVPLGTGTASYSGSMSNDRYVNMAGYTDTFNDGLDSYSLNAGLNSGGGLTSQRQINAYYSHRSPLANLSANIASLQKGYTSFGVSASGGATITGKGAALHAGGMSGGTRLLVDTDGVGGVPVDGGQVVTNRWGTGVVTDISSYYRNTTSVDLKRLPDDVEATRSVVESALTEGAIGYRKFSVLKGKRLFAILRLADGSQPPFGASVTSEKGRELGMVADEGLAWLSGVTPGETLSVNWDGKIQCQVNVPETAISDQQLLLPCTPQK